MTGGPPNTTRDHVFAAVREFYDRVWQDWYRGYPHLRPARLVLVWEDESEGTPGYWKKKDELYVYLGEQDAEEIEKEKAGQRYRLGHLGWYIWKVNLVHEMLHEYQFKALKEATPAGRALRASVKHNFEGQGHDDLFYTAVAEKASYFGVTPEQLLSDM